MIRILVAALALAGGTLVPSLPASAQGGVPATTAWHEGPCTDNVGITIVVDFQELGGGVNVRCAPGPVTSGLDALDQGDIAWEGTRRFAGVVCRIAGLPEPADEACIDTPPASAYWAYWLAPRGGAWCYSTVGPGSRTPPPGSVEGWSFSLGKVGAGTPPPRFEVPPAIDGQPPNPIAPGECGAPAPAPSTTTTSAPATTVAATHAASTTVASPPAPTGAPVATTTIPAPRVTSAKTTTTTTIGDVGSASTSSMSPSSTSTTSLPPSTSSSSSSSSSSSTSAPTTTSTTTSVSTTSSSLGRLGTVDLSDDRRGDGGFGGATAAGIVSIAGLAGTAIWIARRRRIVA